jgi:hypothetical protein
LWIRPRFSIGGGNVAGGEEPPKRTRPISPTIRKATVRKVVTKCKGALSKDSFANLFRFSMDPSLICEGIEVAVERVETFGDSSWVKKQILPRSEFCDSLNVL